MKYTKQQWYTPAEVVVHNQANDCWISLNGKVLDMTEWLGEQSRLCTCMCKSCSCKVKSWFCEDTCVEYCKCFKQGYSFCDKKRLAMTILAYAGKDLSHWFNGSEWVRHIHPVTGACTVVRPHGHGPRQPVVPSTKWRPYDAPWWLDEKLVIGRMTARARPIRIVNTLTGSTVTLEVCSEETIYEIMMRYARHNSHMASYTWRYLGRPLCKTRTLEENGVPDERDRFSDVLLPENQHIPAILVYYNDDLTEVCRSYSWRYLGRPLCKTRTLEENGVPDERDRFSDVLLPENQHIPAILVYYNDDLTEDPDPEDCFCADTNCLKDRPVTPIPI